MSIIDITNDLQNIKNSLYETKNNDENSKNIEHTNNITKLEEFINSKVVNVYCFPWNKLDIKLKIRKLKEYINNMDISNKDIHLQNLTKIVKSKKKLNVDYDTEKGIINNIEYDFNV